MKDIPRGNAGLVLAQSQEKGRGRQGRVWQESSTGFYGTFVFKSQAKLDNFFCLPLVVGLGISETLADLSCDTHIKWPNDLLSVGGRKICGILIEYVRDGDFNTFLVGIGINLQGEPSGESRAVSIFTETGKIYSPTFVGARLGEKLFNFFGEVEESGFHPFRERWLSRTKGLDSPLSIHVGREIVTGIFRGVGPLGYLLLEINGEIKEISSGELISEAALC
jgi:BirA family biotin operon repressor/biotin-[acetyl-CoA-carboxylase] ligase